MNHKIIAAIEKYRMLDGAESVLAAVSGGPDSMAMLHWLHMHAKQYGYTLYAAHLNHCLRGAESDRDENLVRNVCKSLGVELFCERRDIAALAKEQKLSIELAARNARYGLFSQISEKLPRCRVATAHTASDNAETVLLNLTRGTGLSGLCGIPPVRGNIIRPLIECTRKDVLDYCNENGIQYFIDSSNLTDDYTRNVIRNRVIPVLLELNPSFLDGVSRMICNLREDAQYLDGAAASLISDGPVDADLLSSVPYAIASRAVRLAYAAAAGAQLEKRHVDLVLDLARNMRGKISLPCGFFAEIERGKLKIHALSHDAEPRQWRQRLKIGTNILPSGQIIDAKLFDIDSFNFKLPQNHKSAALDFDKTGADITIRSRGEHDYYHPDRRKGGRSLKRLFIDAKIPREMRHQIPVFEARGEIVWVEGFEPDARFKIDKGTKKVLYITTEANYEE